MNREDRLAEEAAQVETKAVEFLVEYVLTSAKVLEGGITGDTKVKEKTPLKDIDLSDHRTICSLTRL